MANKTKLAVHFGAGNIGRAFIGDVLHKNGYHIVFVDSNAAIVERLNKTPRYEISILAEPTRIEAVTDYEAVLGSDVAKLLPLLHQAELITISIGAPNLKYLVPVLQTFINQKASDLVSAKKVQNIVCAENGVRVTSQLKAMLEVPSALDETLGFVDAAVDRIVPATSSPSLDVACEDFYEFALSAPQWRGKDKLVGADYYDDITPIIERKVLMLNGTHAYIAWLGFDHYSKIHEFTGDVTYSRMINDYVSNLANLLSKKYPSFKLAQMREYAYKVVERFSNPLLEDAITRVGRNIKTKIGPTERIISPLLYAWQNNLPYAAYIRALLAALAPKVYDDPEYQVVKALLDSKGLEAVLREVCQLTDEELITKIKAQAERLGFHFKP